MTDKPKLKRRWLQFSLRTMLVVVTVFCVWIGITAKRARDQKRAVEALNELQVQIVFDWQNSEGGFAYGANSVPPGPDWLRQFIGEDYFMTVVALNFEQTETTDSDLMVLNSLPEVRWLSLYDTAVTDSGLAHLKSLTKLETLIIFYTGIGDAGLEHLRGLTNLKSLTLGNTQVTDSGLVHLKGLPNLKLLYLENTQVTKEGVKNLQQALPNCKIIH